MKQLNLLIIIVLSFHLLSFSQSATESRPIKPSGFQKKIVTVVSGKNRSYYALSNAEASVISVQGPGTLKVHTRAQFRTGDAQELKYTVLYSIDGAQQQSNAVTGVTRSAKAVYQDGTLGVPGENNSYEIELSRGSHTIEFRLKDIATNVAARYIFTPSKLQKQDWQAFSPMRPSEPVDLISKESTTAYYRFSLEKPLKVDIIGPTELRVLTRTENHYQMKGRINYRVQVKENGAVINTYLLYSHVSDVAVYKDVKNLIPGSACEFVIYVPKGKHIYEIVPLDQDKSTLLGRLLIPVKDVKLEVN
jgi:hypothetical protein